MDRFMRIKEVCTQLGLSRSTLYRLVNDGAFPRPIAISKKSKAWPESAVIKYQRERIAAAESPAAVG